MADFERSMDESLSVRELSAEHLAEDFGIRAATTRQCVGRLYEAILREGDVFLRWHQLFTRLWGPAEARLCTPLAVLGRRIGIADARPLPMLFAMQTYYSLLLALLVKRFDVLRPYEIIDPVFQWCFESKCRNLRAAIDRIGDRLECYDVLGWTRGRRATADGGDLLKLLHHSLFARAIRHHLGEYYTPDWLAAHVLDQLRFDSQKDGRLLDPACGSGTFLMAAIRRIRQRADGAVPCPAPPSVAEITRRVVGIDLNPLAVMSARANYLMAIHDLLSPGDDLCNIPVYPGDSILGLESARLSAEPFDFVAGNPPWIAWDNLPGEYRDATKPLWEQYGLFSLSGNAARHGGGKKDLSMLMLYTAADRYLKRGGRLGFVITQTLFQSKGAGDGFRRFRLGDGDPLKVLRVDDLTAIKPFEDAANWTSTILLTKGEPTEYPVPYVRWKAIDAGQDSSSVGRDSNPSRGRKRPVRNSSYETVAYFASPIDPSNPTSPWLVRPSEENGDSHEFIAAAPSDYRARLGANSGGANGVYWVEVLGAADGGVRIRNVVEKSKRPIERVECVIEPDLLYPLVRWSDLARYAALPRYHLLLVQNLERRVGMDESLLARQFPLTYAYLRHFEPLLASRAAYRRYQRGQPFYSMYNVGPYTAAEHKVIWRRMDKRLTAAVVGPIEHPLLGRRAVVPQETCVLVACESAEESHYLAAMLASKAAGRLLESHSVRSGKGFGTPSILENLPIRRFAPESRLHRELAACSREAHAIVGKEGGDAECEIETLDEVQSRIDRLAKEVFSKPN
jgi:SAM-dependent methyltransferase